MNKLKTLRGRGWWWGAKWALILIGGGFLAWRMVVVGISQQLVRNGSSESVEIAARWSPDNPDALLARAFDLSDSNPREAEQLLLQAIWLAPGNGRMFTRLGHLLERRGEKVRAEQAMRIAEKLAPRNSSVQAELAEFWGRRNQPEPYLRHLVTVLDLNPDFWAQLHPALLAVVDDPAHAVLVRQVLSEALAERDPFWWKPFFYFARLNASRLDTVRLLYSIRTGSYSAPSDQERLQFLYGLEEGQQWLEAYFVWLNALNEEQLTGLGNVFNGSFSFPLMNEGYGWRYVTKEGVDVGAEASNGSPDGRALRVSFSGRQGQTIQLSQTLMLPPGEYALRGRVRTVALAGEQTPYWRILCVAPERSMVGVSAGFSGIESWQPFSVDFDIPAKDCDLQRLRLVQNEGKNQGKMITGTLWIDDLLIQSLD